MLDPMTDHHLAQLNLGRLRAPLDAAEMADFVALLEPVNALADRSEGFVWRFRSEGAPDATGERPFGDDLLVNMSVWESAEALWNFTYRSEHLDLLRRRRDWFLRFERAYLALWWIPVGHRPTPAEAGERLRLLRENGPTPAAFTLKTRFPAPGAPDVSGPAQAAARA